MLQVNGDQARLTRRVLTSLNKLATLPAPLQARWTRSGEQSLDKQLLLSFGCSCSDLRDHVYAILSLLHPDVRSLIPIDYSLTVEQVYTNVILACVEHYKSLDIIEYAARSMTRDCSSLTESFTIDQFQQFLVHKKSYRGPEPTSFPVGWLDKVHLSSEPTTQITSKLWALPAPIHQQRILPRFRVNAHCIQICQWSDLCSDEAIERLHDELRLDVVDILPARWPKILFSDNGPVPEAEKFRIRRILNNFMGSYTPGDCIFTTNSGIGRCTISALPGDRICHLDGVKTRLLLRRVDGVKHRIVSACWWEPFKRSYQPESSVEIVEVF